MSVARQEQPPFLTKRDYAHVELRRRILDGALAPGTRLLLRPIAEELGVSVMPVRDAIRLLERDGLVTVENHRGATVTQIPRETVVESVGIRMWLEVLAVREATPSHTAQTLATAERALGEAEGAAASGQPLRVRAREPGRPPRARGSRSGPASPADRGALGPLLASPPLDVALRDRAPANRRGGERASRDLRGDPKR